MSIEHRSYRDVVRGQAKNDGKFNVAFGEHARLSSFSMETHDHKSYEFTTSGQLRRGRGNRGDLGSDQAVAREACRLMKNPEFIKKTLEQFQDKRYAITERELKSFAENIERHYALYGEKDSLTSKLMS